MAGTLGHNIQLDLFSALLLSQMIWLLILLLVLRPQHLLLKD